MMDGSRSIDEGHLIKKRKLAFLSVIKCAYTLFIRLTVKLHLPLFLYHRSLKKLRARLLVLDPNTINSLHESPVIFCLI